MNLRRLAPTAAALAALTITPAHAAESSHMAAWGVLHVTVSLIGTVFVIWLLDRGVKKL